MSGSIITRAAIERCASEAKHREHVEALRAIALAIAIKRIHDDHNKMLIGEAPWVVDTARPARCRVSDMCDVDLRLSE